ncbi:alpha/beta hydrolase [Allokutzneria sp. A3M-2-11 16]|uniref:alpha/beta fold hydrolase n=1 Tax=Allokutzneria sp. A3M-2-11 16 TaxID=2962043 RepID=UPI0020B8F408|nr:alpha/beta hydrolase [Allokutzneria sp. A3M-2-11 16]MCP3804010.1 alpha/beta hydrolase [Allokutzneria sp. A3M-2-11 16]
MRFVEVDGVRVHYREAGSPEAPTVLLLHGFPSASHQFRGLMEQLADRFHVVAPDYPGFGHSDTPDVEYSFDWLSEVVEGFIEALGLKRFVMYAFDYGVPVGFRIATRRPEWIAGLVVQNGNAYEDGLSDLARDFIEKGPAPEVFTLPFTRSQYETGVSDVDAIAPDGWTLDQYFMDLPGRKEIQTRTARDYRSNVELYPVWQQWLRDHRPPTLVVWGTGDPFFTDAGARAYLRDLPDAELHLFATGHFALEEKLAEIAPLVADFVIRTSG